MRVLWIGEGVHEENEARAEWVIECLPRVVVNIGSLKSKRLYEPHEVLILQFVVVECIQQLN